MTFSAYLFSLFSSAFISATLLPGGSEALLLWGISEFTGTVWTQILTATAGNSLGSMVTYLIGRFIPNKTKAKSVEFMKKWGAPALLFAWLPVVGDGFCLAAGWLKVPALLSLILITIGKFLRYAFLAGAFNWIFG